MKKFFSLALVTLILASLSLAFQNCGNISVAPIVADEVASKSSQILPEGNFCSQSGPVFGSQVRFVFILDMSISNLGNATPRCQDRIDENGKCGWYLGMFLDPAQDPIRNKLTATDPVGLRFDVIDGDGTNGKPKGFLLECGTQVDFQYSVFGFSTDTMFGEIADSCMTPFKTAQNVKNNVSALRKVQESDIRQNGAYEQPYISPFQMGETYYSKAISCLQKKVEYDAALTTDQPTYQVFFMTDGRPTDYLRAPCVGLSATEDLACKSKYATYYACESQPTTTAQIACRTNFYIESFYKPSLLSLKNYTESVSGNLKFTPIYYGRETGDAKTNAMSALESMADIVSPDPAQNVREISDFTTLSKQLCEAYKPQAKVNYSQKSAWIVNLTSIFLHGKHEPDSDMDGIADFEDLDPLNPRHSGQVLDKLCRLKNSHRICAKPATNCELENVGWGLNRCDVLIAKEIYGKDLTGFDTDSDGLPDFLEIRFGLNPTLADMGSANLDGDLESNAQEIMQGLNPEEADAQVSEKDRTLWTMAQVNQSGCSSGSQHTFRVKQLPLAENKAFSGSISGIDASVGDGENLLAVVSLQESTGRPNLKKKMTLQWIRSSELAAPKVGPVHVIGDY